MQQALLQQNEEASAIEAIFKDKGIGFDDNGKGIVKNIQGSGLDDFVSVNELTGKFSTSKIKTTDEASMIARALEIPGFDSENETAQEFLDRV
jgi:hypothetical protein